MYCGRCHTRMRDDDPGQVRQTTETDAGTLVTCSVTAFVCSACAANLDGEVPPKRKTYPPGREYSFNVCGVCRHAMPNGEWGHAMRLAPTDVEGTDIQPGCYQACTDCVGRFRVKMRARLVATGYQNVPGTVDGDWLL